MYGTVSTSGWEWTRDRSGRTDLRALEEPERSSPMKRTMLQTADSWWRNWVSNFSLAQALRMSLDGQRDPRGPAASLRSYYLRSSRLLSSWTVGGTCAITFHCHNQQSLQPRKERGGERGGFQGLVMKGIGGGSWGLP